MKRVLALSATLLATVVAVGLLRLSLAHPPVAVPAGNALSQAAPPPDEALYTILALGLLVLGGFLAGEIVATFRLPRVTAYLLFGILAGPSFATWLPRGFPTLVPRGELRYLELMNALAVSLIGLVAGSEIRVSFLRTAGRRITQLVLCDAGGVVLFVAVLLAAISGSVPLLSLRTPSERWFLVAVLCALAIANSPAIVTALLRETRATGPFARTALAMTVLKDLALVILISGLLASWSASQSQGGGWSAALGVSWHLVGSLVVGLAFSMVLGLLANLTRFRLDLAVIVAGFAIAVAGRLLDIAPLLAGITAGFALANASPKSSRRLFHSVDNLLPTTYAIFFAVTGAKISLDSFLQIWPLALGISAARLAGILAGLRVGCQMAAVAYPVRRWLWTAMVPQAGVSIALAAEVSLLFRNEPWVGELESLMLATIVVNEIIGPPLMRLGVVRSGELQA
ncbi:MAG: cation:proton antiporter [Planctomycetes bacterium]|nr:cation:proton antiporter [Planctomycetota bacterium]